jgi:hypothetical protein
MDPSISCRHSLQSNDTDCVKAATSAPGPAAKRPLRETGERFFIDEGNLAAEGGKVTLERGSSGGGGGQIGRIGPIRRIAEKVGESREVKEALPTGLAETTLPALLRTALSRRTGIVSRRTGSGVKY